MTQSQAARHWLKSAKRNVKVAEDSFKAGHYDWSLFFWHLVLEKTLKGLIINRGKIPPPVHNLRYLAKTAGLNLTKRLDKNLKEITGFNLEARYDDYKFKFYKKATSEFTKKWAQICREAYQWLLKKI